LADYIVQKPVDFTKLTAKAKKSLPAMFDITPKYDGCCAAVLFNGQGKFIGAFSATGEDVLSLGHVGAFIEQRWPVKTLRNIAVLGEAWHPDWDFPTINGTFRRRSIQAALRFAPFDLVAWEPGDLHPLLGDDRPYRERVAGFEGTIFGDCVVGVPHYLGDLDAGNKLAREFKAKGGYDGAIARDPAAPYLPGRCKQEVIKLKPVLELDLRVVSHAVQPGEKTGRAVVTLCVDYRGIETWVGSGVPHDLDIREVRPGTIVAIEAMGLTPDGKLREPRFKGVRHDKLEPDT
jgi:ATP-dependent DNA ligase